MTIEQEWLKIRQKIRDHIAKHGRSHPGGRRDRA